MPFIVKYPISLTMRLCLSRVLRNTSWGLQTSLRNWVTIKVSYRYLRKYLLICMYQDWDLSLRVTERYTLGPLGSAHSVKLAST